MSAELTVLATAATGALVPVLPAVLDNLQQGVAGNIADGLRRLVAKVLAQPGGERVCRAAAEGDDLDQAALQAAVRQVLADNPELVGPVQQAVEGNRLSSGSVWVSGNHSAGASNGAVAIAGSNKGPISTAR